MREMLMPHNNDAECSLLAICILQPQLLHQITGVLNENDFYTEDNRVIYEVLLALHEKKRPIDLITIEAELETRGKLKREEDYYRLTRLVTDMSMYYTAPGESAQEHARMLRELSLYRAAILKFTHLVSLAYQQDPAMMQIALESVKALEEQSIVGTHAFSSLGEIATPYLEVIAEAFRLQGKLSGVTTGYHDLNRLTNGWQRSDLIILAARPGVGKTTFSLNLGDNSAKVGLHIGYFSMEMGKFQLFNKLVAMGIPLNSQSLLRGTFDDDDWARIISTTEDMTQRHISICDRSGLSIQELSSLAKTLHAQSPLDMIIVDYLQLMRAYINGKRIENRQQEVTEIAQGLKNLARELNIPVLALAQLSRGVESRQSKVPQLSDLRESGSIEQEADIVMFLYRDDIYNPDSERKNIVDLIIAKHRSGAVGEISLYFDNATSRFTNLELSPAINGQEE